MFTINKRVACSLVAFAIAVRFNTVAAHENEREKYEPKELSFALWGDMPYAKNGDAPKIQALIDDINASKVAFTVFEATSRTAVRFATTRNILMLSTTLTHSKNRSSMSLAITSGLIATAPTTAVTTIWKDSITSVRLFSTALTASARKKWKL